MPVDARGVDDGRIALSSYCIAGLCIFGGKAWMLKIHFWVHRVPSEENISDLPSREYYQLMEDIDAEWLEPTVAGLFMASNT